MSAQEQAAAAKKVGNGFYKNKEYEKAIEEYTKAIKLYDKDHSYYSNRSACYAEIGKFDEALADGKKCVELKPDWAKGYGRVGLALFKLGKVDEAKKSYEDGLKIDGNNATLKDGLNQCEQAAKGGGGGGGKGLFGPQIWQTISLDPELRPYMSDQDFVQKINMLNANPQMAMQMGVLNDPKIKKVFEKMMGMSFSGMDDQKDGDSTMKDAPSNPYGKSSGCDDSGTCCAEKEDAKKDPTPEPEPPKELTEEEKQQLEQEEKEREERRLQEAEALKHKEAGNVLYKEKKYEEAIAEYKKAQEIDPKKSSYVLNESAALFMMEKWDETLACCQRAIEVARENFDDLKWTFKAYNRMGSVEHKRGNVPKALEYYKKALVEKKDEKLRKMVKKMERVHAKKEQEAYEDPELAEKLKNEGNALFKELKFGDAISKYTEALKRNPKDHKIYSNRATCFCKLMRWDAAMADCDAAIKLEPTFIKAYIRKGKINHCLKQYHKALQAFKAAKAIDSTVEDLIIAERDTLMAIQQRNMSGQVTEEERQRALQDPEVQAAMNDPEVSSVLLQAQSGDQTILMKAMRDRPHIKDKIEYLMAAGVLRLG